MTILITGGAGLLGSALIRTAPEGVEVHATRRNAPVHGVPSHAVDLADAEAVRALFDRLRPALVIHTAYGKTDFARDIVSATRNVADACAVAGAALIHLSTDVVFDGEHPPYSEDAEPSPITGYGRAKAEAEAIVRAAVPSATIVRTSIILRTLGEDEVVRQLRAGTLPPAFVDELRCPIADVDLAAQLWELATLNSERIAGTWHLAGPEAVSRHAMAVLLAVGHGIPAERVAPGLNRTFSPRRPRDLRLLTHRADRELRTRARPLSEVLFPAD